MEELGMKKKDPGLISSNSLLGYSTYNNICRYNSSCSSTKEKLKSLRGKIFRHKRSVVHQRAVTVV